MSRYIPCDKIKKLREAARNGDEVAKRILMAQLDDDADFSEDLENYFKPQEEEKVEEVAEAPQEEVKQPETDAVQAQPSVLTGQIPEGDISNSLINLISACDKKTLEIANDSEITDATKRGALSILQDIKQSCLDNLEKFGKLMSSISKKSVEEEL